MLLPSNERSLVIADTNNFLVTGSSEELDRAALESEVNRIRYLVKKGANPTWTLEMMLSKGSFSGYVPDFATCERLLECGAKPSQKMLEKATSNSHVKIVKLLVEHGASIAPEYEDNVFLTACGYGCKATFELISFFYDQVALFDEKLRTRLLKDGLDTILGNRYGFEDIARSVNFLLEKGINSRRPVIDNLYVMIVISKKEAGAYQRDIVQLVQKLLAEKGEPLTEQEVIQKAEYQFKVTGGVFNRSLDPH